MIGAVLSFTDVSDRIQSRVHMQKRLHQQQELLELLQRRAVDSDAEQKTHLHRMQLLSELAHRRIEQLEAIFDHMPDGAFVCDAEGWLTLVNRSGQLLFGRSFEELQGKQISALFEQVEACTIDGVALSLEQLPPTRALSGEAVNFEDLRMRVGSSAMHRYVRISAFPLLDSVGKSTGAIIIVRDISDELDFERLKGEFIQVAAHELKTPVAIMKGYAQSLLRSAPNLDTAARRALQSINRGADRIDRIVMDLLDISQFELGRFKLRHERFDLALLAEEVIAQVQPRTGLHSISAVSKSPFLLNGDKERITQVLRNLLENAIKYSPGGGGIVLSMELLINDAVVSVLDMGIGIPLDQQPFIFQRFFRAHADTRHDYGGLGVGLYICDEIVRAHRGRMWFQSSEGQGSTFYFSLPAEEWYGADRQVEGADRR